MDSKRKGNYFLEECYKVTENHPNCSLGAVYNNTVVVNGPFSVHVGHSIPKL